MDARTCGGWRSGLQGGSHEHASADLRSHGTLVDSVYQHVLAWHEALQEAGIELSVWRIHRRIGMSGGLFTRALLRETGRELDEALLSRLQEHHTAAYKRPHRRGAAAARRAPPPGAP